MPTQPTAFDRLVQVLQEMPEQKREDFAVRVMRQIEEEISFEQELESDFPEEESENDRRWDETLHSPQSLEVLEKLGAQALKDHKEGKDISHEEFKRLYGGL